MDSSWAFGCRGKLRAASHIKTKRSSWPLRLGMKENQVRHLIAFACLLSGVSLPAEAQNLATSANTSAYVTRVAVSPSDLSSDEGIANLQFRVRRAVRRLCNQTSEIRMWAGGACYADATEDALSQVDRVVRRWRSGESLALATHITVKVQ